LLDPHLQSITFEIDPNQGDRNMDVVEINSEITGARL